MIEKVQHQSPFKDGHQKWRDGSTCEACQRRGTKLRAGLKGKRVHMNIHRLMADNAGGYSQKELGDEVIAAAKKDGREIERYR